MADLGGLGGQPEGNNFDDFEKLEGLDPLVSSGGSADEFNVSSSNIPSNPLDEDLYTAKPAVDTSEAQPAQPLLDFGEATKPVEPQFKADTTKPAESKKETPAESGSTGSNWFKNIDPKVLDLIYWRDVKKSGVVFGSMMLMLLSLAMFSVLSVVAYLTLAGLTVTVSFRVYKNILGAVQKSGEGHPFKKYLDMDCALPQDKVHQVADHISDHLSCNLRELRRLFLVEDLVDSIKFGLLLWVLTYIGAWFNGMTLIILGVIAIFTLPKFYEVNKEKIDELVGIAREHIKKVMSQIKEKIPIGKKEKTQ